MLTHDFVSPLASLIDEATALVEGRPELGSLHGFFAGLRLVLRRQLLLHLHQPSRVDALSEVSLRMDAGCPGLAWTFQHALLHFAVIPTVPDDVAVGLFALSLRPPLNLDAPATADDVEAMREVRRDAVRAAVPPIPDKPIPGLWAEDGVIV